MQERSLVHHPEVTGSRPVPDTFMMKHRIRTYPQSNYRAIFFNGKTIRQKLRQSEPFGAIPHPELEDVAINDKCLAGCSYCYTSALKTGSNFDRIIEKAHEVYGSLDLHDRPFQIAIGGAGESTMHQDWPEFVKEIKNLGIVPNYTTNGMHLSDKVMNATEAHCGGVALSWHPHIKKYFHMAMEKLGQLKDAKLNTHVIVGEPGSLEDLKELYARYQRDIDYFVVLPYQAAGRAKEVDVNSCWNDTFAWINQLEKEEQSKFAFGALFYEWMKGKDLGLDMSLYEPEIFSGYRIMDDSYKLLRKSSYDLRPKGLIDNQISV